MACEMHFCLPPIPLEDDCDLRCRKGYSCARRANKGGTFCSFTSRGDPSRVPPFNQLSDGLLCHNCVIPFLVHFRTFLWSLANETVLHLLLKVVDKLAGRPWSVREFQEFELPKLIKRRESRGSQLMTTWKHWLSIRSDVPGKDVVPYNMISRIAVRD